MSEDRGTRDPRAESFLRLNGFLWRTHLTCLVSALSEDGWLETWERESLCDLARGGSPPPQSFMRIYMRFMETDDVHNFVAALRAQIS